MKMKTRCVVIYDIGDAIHGCYTQVIPAEYESTEQLLYDFQVACKDAYGKKEQLFTIGGCEFEVDCFIFRDYERGEEMAVVWPKVYTIDEWFADSLEDKIV